MIMTASARNGQAQDPAGQRINSIVPLVSQGFRLFTIVLIVDGPQRKHPQRRHSLGITRASQQVTRNLFAQESIVGQVLIKRFDHPVPVTKSLRIVTRLEGVRLILAIAGNIQPMSPPAFSVMR